MLVQQNFLSADSKCYTHQFLTSLQCITLHWTGPYPGQTPSMVRDWWECGETDASAHFIIKDEECMQTWPKDVVAWHCGDVFGNRHSIGIEVIPENTEGKFSDKSIETLKELLDTRFTDLPICRHYDWGTFYDPVTGKVAVPGKLCPQFYCDEQRWQNLLDILGHPFYNVDRRS